MNAVDRESETGVRRQFDMLDFAAFRQCQVWDEICAELPFNAGFGEGSLDPEKRSMIGRPFEGAR